MRAAFDAAGVALRVDVPEDLPPVDADPDRLGQVLRNLLDNARRHTPRGGHVLLAAQQVDEAIELRVSDSGPGIRPEVMATLFERGTHESGGSGLGLAIVRSLVAAHGGTVDVRSRPGEGASFTLRWPLAREAAASREARRAEGPTTRSPAGGAPTT